MLTAVSPVPGADTDSPIKDAFDRGLDGVFSVFGVKCLNVAPPPPASPTSPPTPAGTIAAAFAFVDGDGPSCLGVVGAGDSDLSKRFIILQIVKTFNLLNQSDEHRTCTGYIKWVLGTRKKSASNKCSSDLNGERH